MSESEIKEAAERYANEKYPQGHASPWYLKQGFIAGCEQADKEAYNRALSDVSQELERWIDVAGRLDGVGIELIEELQKLRK